MNAQNKKFWMVWNLDELAPKYRHYSEGNANTEAIRLARAHPGSTFVVMEAKSAKTVQDILTIEFNESSFEDEIPF